MFTRVCCRLGTHARQPQWTFCVVACPAEQRNEFAACGPTDQTQYPSDWASEEGTGTNDARNPDHCISTEIRIYKIDGKQKHVPIHKIQFPTSLANNLRERLFTTTVADGMMQTWQSQITQLSLLNWRFLAPTTGQTKCTLILARTKLENCAPVSPHLTQTCEMRSVTSMTTLVLKFQRLCNHLSTAQRSFRSAHRNAKEVSATWIL